MLPNRYGGCVWEIFGSAGLPIPVLHTYAQLHPIRSASEAVLASKLTDDVRGTHRSIALALSRLADGVHLLVERALDHIDSPNPAGYRAKG